MKSRNLVTMFILFMLVLLTYSCELKRSNPLDPDSNTNIYVPDRVVGLNAAGSGPGVLSKYVELRWSKNQENTDGYYIYMGLAYNSAYKKVGWTSNVNPDSTLSKIVPLDAPGFYYFKVSAYKYYGSSASLPNPIEDSSGYLEGSLSEWAIAHVDD